MSTAGGKVGIKEEDEVDSELGHQQEKWVLFQFLTLILAAGWLKDPLLKKLNKCMMP
jgi:hypothetical protein